MFNFGVMKSNFPIISIIIIAYNEEKRIKKAIKSAMRQSLKEIEIIVVDDGSTDRTVERAMSLASFDKRVRVVQHRENRGMVSARVTGIETAVGEYVTFLDADDTLCDRAVEEMHKVVREHDVDVVQMGCYVEMKHLPKRFRYFIPSSRLDKVVYDVDEAREVLYSGKALNNVWSKLYRRKLLLTVGLRRSGNNYGEDIMFNHQVFSHGATLATTDYLGYNYRMADAGLSRLNRWRDVMTAHVEMLDAMTDGNESLRRAYADRIAQDMISSIALRLLNPFNNRRLIRQFITTELCGIIWNNRVLPLLGDNRKAFINRDVDLIFNEGKRFLRQHYLGCSLSYIMTII